MNIDHIVERIISGSKGQQVRRKDKDLMRDTGGISKGRGREPEQKPPRDEKKVYREKRLTPDQKKDTEKDDREVKKQVRRKSFVFTSSYVHPLDRTGESSWGGLKIPENNYHRQVLGALWGIIEESKGVSEKDFTGQDEIKAKCDEVIRSPEAEEIVQRFATQGSRPQFCAECIYDRMGN